MLGIGGPTTALFKVGSSAMMGIFLLICGTSINIRQAGLPLYKGAVLLFLKCLAGALAVWAAGALFGPNGFLGISTLALIACLTSSNSSLYIALCSNYGDASDAGAISVFCVKDGPFVTMMVLGVSGLANIPFAALLSMLIPLLIGMLWGNLDERFKQLCAAAQPLIIIIMSFAIGAKFQYQHGIYRRSVGDPARHYLCGDRHCVLFYLQPVPEEENRAGSRAGYDGSQLGADASNGRSSRPLAGDVR
ncbi:2-keto-3-deoxygluconate permease [Raoultella ornithinolytica]|nr:2-keto-3-deoxygluconate permease [Raoultella ornithinolytica]